MNFEEANRKRDKRLRRRLLATLHNARRFANRGLGGRALADIVNGSSPANEQFEDDGHALGLLRDLVNKGYATEKDQRRRRTERLGLDYLFFDVTATGSSLIEESIDPDPDVDDERNLEN